MLYAQAKKIHNILCPLHQYTTNVVQFYRRTHILVMLLFMAVKNVEKLRKSYRSNAIAIAVAS